MCMYVHGLCLSIWGPLCVHGKHLAAMQHVCESEAGGHFVGGGVCAPQSKVLCTATLSIVKLLCTY